MALSLEGAGFGGGATLNLAIPSVAAPKFAGAGTSANRQSRPQVRAPHAAISGLPGRRRLHTSHTSDSSHASHTSSAGAEQQTGECSGDFSVMSTLWADSAGCYLDLGSSVYEYVGEEGTYMIAPVPLYNSEDSASVWVAGTVAAGAGVDDVTTIDPHCHSEGDTDLHGHPADAELWLCDIDNTGIVYTEVTAEEFSGECGCSADAAAPTPAPTAGSRDLGTPVPAPVAESEEEAPTPAPTAAVAAAPTLAPETRAPVGDADNDDDDAGGSSVTTSETPNGLCGEIQPLSVATSLEELDGVDGCYEETGHEYHEEGGHFFSITGSHLRGQYAVFPGYMDPQSLDPRWFLGFLAIESEDTVIYCVSQEPPSSGHPSTASWSCNDGTGEFVSMEGKDFDVLCDCDSASSAASTSDSTSVTAAPSMSPDHDDGSHSPGTAAPSHGDGDSHAGPSAAPSAMAPGPTTAPESHDHGSDHGETSAPVAAGGGAQETEAPAAEHTGSEHTSTSSAGGSHDHTNTTSSAGGSHDHTTTTSAGEDHDHTTTTSSAGGSHDHTTTTSAGEDHDGASHSGEETPSPTTVARGIAGPPDTPAPVGGDTSVESTEASAGYREALPGFFGRVTVATVGAAALAVAAGGAMLRCI